MNKKLYEIIKEYHLHPTSFIKKGKVYIIQDKNKAYVIKLNTNNYDIYKYLLSRNYTHIPKFLNTKNDNYEIREYEDNYKIEDEQRVNDLIKELALLHHKTSYIREIDLDDIKKNYEELKNKINNSKTYYLKLNDIIDKELFFSPSEYLLIRNISLFYFLLDYANKNLDEWYQNIKNEQTIRVSLLHNNVDIKHLIINDNKYLISWDKSSFGSPIYDIESFYRKYYYDLELGDTYKIYELINNLNNYEKKLLLINLVIPSEIKLTSNTYLDTININNEINYLNKIFMYIKTSEKDKVKE